MFKPLPFDTAYALLKYGDELEKKVKSVATERGRYPLEKPTAYQWFYSTGEDTFRVHEEVISAVTLLGGTLRSVTALGTIQGLPDSVASRARFLESAHLAVLQTTDKHEYERQKARYG